jgi:hypothetical protein
MKTKLRIKGLIALIGSLVILFVVLVYTSTLEPEVSIVFERLTNSGTSPTASLRFSNPSGVGIKLDAHCTLYWKDSSGQATNTFARYTGGRIILPGQSTSIGVTSPADIDVWQTSFSYTALPGALGELYNLLLFKHTRAGPSSESFHGRFGPIITNSTSKAATDVFLNTEPRPP